MTILFKTDWNSLDIPIPYWIFYQENISIENGKLKITWKINPAEPSHRPRITLPDMPNEYWTEAKFVLPSHNEGWFIFFEPYNEIGSPNAYSAQFVLGANFELDFELKDVYTQKYYFKQQVGQFSPNEEIIIVFHVKRDSVNGIVEVWINGVKKVDYRGSTVLVPDSRILCLILDCYKSPTQSEQTVYQDSFVLGTEANDVFEKPGPLIEPPPPDPFTIEVKPCIVTAAGAPLALLTGLRVIREYLPGWFVRGYYDFSKFVLAGW